MSLLTGTLLNNATKNYNLTTEGGNDWIRFYSALQRKLGGGSQISTFSMVGGGTTNYYTNDPSALNWTDGSPTLSSSDSNGVYTASTAALTEGFSFTAPADIRVRRLTLHLGKFSAGSKLVVSISDVSSANYQNIVGTAGGSVDLDYEIQYQAASNGQTLTVTYTNNATPGGNVSIRGAAMFLLPKQFPNIGIRPRPFAPGIAR